MHKKERITREERLSMILTYLENLKKAVTISKMARDLKMHYNTIANEISYIALVQQDLRKIETIETEKQMFVRIKPRKGEKQ
jgi:hypothetical protein